MNRLILALVATCTAFPVFAQDIPALEGASAEERARIEGLIEAAKEEGAVSYLDTVIQPQTHDALAAAFREYYGLPDSFQVNYTLSSSSNLVTRVQQELNADRITTDVAAVASPSWVFERVENGDVLEYHSPEYEHYQTVFDMGLGQDGYFAFNGGYVFVPMWNADQVDFEGTSLTDVIGAVPEGRISIGDASSSTSYLATYAGQREVMDQEFFQNLAAMNPNFLVRSEQIASRLVSGEDLMAYSGMPTRAYQYNQRGANLDFMFPEEGVVLLPQNMFILADAPHPNAAKLWVDFILSEEGQSILAEREALISGRSGFESPLPKYSPSIDDLKLIHVDWKNISTEDLTEIRSEWTETFNP